MVVDSLNVLLFRSRKDAILRENEALKRQNTALQSAVRALQRSSNERAAPIPELQEAARVDETLGDLIMASTIAHSVSPHPTARRLMPPVSSRLEYELTASHPHAYPALASAIDGVSLRTAFRETRPRTDAERSVVDG